MKLNGTKALVTGASSGIGRAIAIALAEKGVYIYINYRKNAKAAQQVLEEVQKHSDGSVVQADLAEKNAVAEIFDTVGPIEILINNAGDARSGNLFDDEVWQYQHENIFCSALYCTQHFLKQTSGRRKIINITSVYGNLNTGNPNLIAYSAYKAALNSLTKNTAKAADADIQINAIAPGYTWTPPWEGIDDAEKQKRENLANIGRYIRPEEIAHTVVATLENDALHGEIITVDGGVSLMKGL